MNLTASFTAHDLLRMTTPQISDSRDRKHKNFLSGLSARLKGHGLGCLASELVQDEALQIVCPNRTLPLGELSSNGIPLVEAVRRAAHLDSLGSG